MVTLLAVLFSMYSMYGVLMRKHMLLHVRQCTRKDVNVVPLSKHVSTIKLEFCVREQSKRDGRRVQRSVNRFRAIQSRVPSVASSDMEGSAQEPQPALHKQLGRGQHARGHRRHVRVGFAGVA